jgi:peptide/nickel transport system permease protein
MGESMATRHARLRFTAKRIKGFLSALWRSKRGMLGVIIIGVAVVVALTAPLLTPFDPIRTTALAASYAAPAWARYLPGGGGYSLNMIPIDESSLLEGANGLKEFNITVTPSNLTQDVIIQQSTFGPSGSPGSLVIDSKVSSLPTNSSLTVQITRDFYYPYSGIPGSLNTYGIVLASRLDGVAVSPTLILGENWLTYTSPGVASYQVTKFDFGASYLNPDLPGPVAFSEDNFTGFLSCSAWLSWQSPQNLQTISGTGYGIKAMKKMFPAAGSYSYGITITVTKMTPSAQVAVIYVNNLELSLGGTSYGLLGTDSLGRDVFTQLVYGTRISLYVGLVAAFLGVVIGLIVGLVAAYVGGIVDEVLMRFTDALLVLPGLPLMIVLIMTLSNGVYSLNILILVIGFLGWMGFARVVRSQVLSLKERPYVEAAKAVGAGTPYILFRHILPNVVVLIYVTLALSVPAAIVTEAAFSFLGFIDVHEMSWGRMLSATINNPSIWWIVVPPGLAILILSLSFILIGYALDDILNPRLRARR